MNVVFIVFISDILSQFSAYRQQYITYFNFILEKAFLQEYYGHCLCKNIHLQLYASKLENDNVICRLEVIITNVHG